MLTLHRISLGSAYQVRWDRNCNRHVAGKIVLLAYQKVPSGRQILKVCINMGINEQVPPHCVYFSVVPLKAHGLLRHINPVFVECYEASDVIKKGHFLGSLSSTSFVKRALIHKYYFVSWCFMSYKLLWVIIVQGFSLNKNTFISCPKYFSRHTMNTTQNISGNVPWCRLLLRSTSQVWTRRFSCHQTLSQLTNYRYWSYLAEHRPHNVKLSANTYRKSYLNLCQNIRWATYFVQ